MVMGIGKRLKNMRLDIGMTQEELAQEIGLSGNYVSEIEQEKKSPSEPIYLAIELKFGVNGAWLKKGTGKKYVPEKFFPTKKEALLLQSLREMPEENKKILLALIEKLKKDGSGSV